ncbi:GspH/FimT family pseudopilin [Noviherbaspirillum aerium]|uniref:GspH/FimT family pseudopilin n=1 Tax=Noviherbaspirillum aerium TaxID=2588497 RepID=UPI001CEF815A|nr:GspH/FimT family pseudopilin [Noviherbaspirillum aerium]
MPAKHHVHDRRRAGFSLIELMTVVLIAAVLAGMAVPAFGRLIDSQRLTSTVNDFLASIQLARAEAIKRGHRVDLVPAGAGWTDGWMVLVDENGNQAPDAGDTIIHRRPPVTKGISVTSKLTDNSQPYLAYNGTGRTRTNVAGGQQPQFGSILFELGDEKRKIILNSLGRPRVCKPKDGETSC